MHPIKRAQANAPKQVNEFLAGLSIETDDAALTVNGKWNQELAATLIGMFESVLKSFP
jgi:hypothetical protein